MGADLLLSFEGSHWTPITFYEKGWGASFRGLVKWQAQQPVRFNGRNLDSSTVNAIATTSDQTYVFAVCLNHTLKIWNLATNKLVASKDLLNRQVQRQDQTSYLLNPSDTSFIRVFNAERAMDGEYRYYVATYSPHEDGCFKFWAVKGGLTTRLAIDDLYPNAVLKPLDPDPSGSMFWNVADFHVKPMEEGRHMELWVLWRNNNLYNLCSVHFDFQSLADDWSTNWVTTALETRRQDSPPALVSTDFIDPTEKWLQYLFHPGRYPIEVLETAFVTYQEALKPRSSGASKKNVSLQGRLCSTIAATVSLRKYSETDMDFTRYRLDTDTKWRQFSQVVEDINKRRFEAIGLAYDFYTDSPWILLSGSCALIRECSSTELVLHNSGSVLRNTIGSIGDRWRHRNLESEFNDRYEQMSYLIEVAADFRKKLPPDLHRTCQTELDAELFLEPSFSAPDRLAAFQERCGLAEQVSDDTFDSLCAAMNEHLNIYALPTELFYSVMDTVPLGFPGKDSDLLSTAFGLRVTVNGSQETILHIRQILYDLLLLVVFIDGEISQEESSTFNSVDLFSMLIVMMKEYEMMTWLASNTRVSRNRLGGETHDSSVPGFSLKSPEPKKGNVITSTILEDLFAIHIKPHPASGIPQTYTLTLGIRDVLSWVTRQGEVAFPNVLVFIQCDLIANGNIDLASDFLRFQPSTAWGTYAKGRLYVARSEFDTAAIYFQKAAHLLCTSVQVQFLPFLLSDRHRLMIDCLASGRALGNLHEMSSNLLDIISVDSFNNGLPKYFQHILTVFEQARSFSHVADFASLALQALTSKNLEPMSKPEYASLRTDLLSRLFHASLKTSQFDKAYSALSRYTDLALQKSALSSLITSILNACGPGTAGIQQLLHFPLAVTPHLSSYLDETLVSLAKKQTSFSSMLDIPNRWHDGNTAPDYHRILHAYRVARNDYRGAAEVGYQTVQRLRKARDTPMQLTLTQYRSANPPRHIVEEDDPESKEIRHELLALINLLACVGKNEAYILVDLDTSDVESDRRRSVQMDNDESVFADPSSPLTPHSKNGRSLSFSSNSVSSHGGTQKNMQRRVVVTLDHLRREYQAELDRVSRIEQGDWEFGAVGTEDVDMDNDLTMVFP